MNDTDDPHRFRHLRGCHPELKWRVRNLVDALAHDGLDILLTQGVRSVAQQQALFAIGRFRPGKIVTNCDGIIKVSNHQVKADGFGYAVDVAWRTPEGLITWIGPWDRMMTLAEAGGLIAGGRWVNFPDRPHLELPLPVPSVRNV